MQGKVGMVLGESVIVQEGPVLIASSLCFGEVHGLGSPLPRRLLNKEFVALFV